MVVNGTKISLSEEIAVKINNGRASQLVYSPISVVGIKSDKKVEYLLRNCELEMSTFF